MKFEWDKAKAAGNEAKHGITFEDACKAFADPNLVIVDDTVHSNKEQRYFCIGKVHGLIVTVRYTLRGEDVRIFGAGYWRIGKAIYEKENP
jgi:uncharacterized DUF497 family protein